MSIVLVTGGNGGIGSAICKYFREKNWYVICSDIQEKCQHKYYDRYI